MNSESLVVDHGYSDTSLGKLPPAKLRAIPKDEQSQQTSKKKSVELSQEMIDFIRDQEKYQPMIGYSVHSHLNSSVSKAQRI